MSRIAAAVCNFNRRDLVRDCIDAILTQGPDLAVCIVDNASTDGSADVLEERFGGRIQLHRNAVNTGGAGGFHRAVAMAAATDAEYLVTVDSDCILAPGALATLAAHLDGHPEVAMAGPKVYWAGRSGVIQEMGAFIDWEAAEIVRNHGDTDETAEQPVAGVEEVDYLPACCLMVRRRAVEEFGNIEPRFFLYFDDVEWCTRIRRGAGRIRATAAATATHHSGGANKTSHFGTYYYWRNRIHFFCGHSPTRLRDRTLTRLRRDLIRAAATCRVLGAPGAAAVIERAASDALAGRWGKADLSDVDLATDPPHSGFAEAHDLPRRRRVGHVLEDVTAEDAGDDGLALIDRFGKTLPARIAWELREEFEQEAERVSRRFVNLGLHSGLLGHVGP